MSRARKLAEVEDEKQIKSTPSLELNHLFEGYSLAEFPKPGDGEVFVLDSTMTILEALRILLDKNYLSAPVQDVNHIHDNWTKRYVGLVDMLDIVTFILAPFLEDNDDVSDVLSSDGSDDFLQFLEFARDDAAVIPLGLLMEIKTSHVDFGGLYPVFEFHTFLNALVALGKHQLHRVLIFPEKGSNLINIVTQSMMCQVLEEKVESDLDHALAEKLNSTTLADVGLAVVRKVHCVDIKDTAMDAFMEIGRHRCGAVPVVDKSKNRKLLGNISARDIRSVFSDKKMYKRMFEPLSEFLVDMKADKINVKTKRPMDVISCRGSDSLNSVFQNVVGFKIHRVYLVNGRNELMRVISLSDLLGVLIK